MSSCSTSYMFDDRKSVGNPGRITYCGAAEDNQQHFTEEAPSRQGRVISERILRPLTGMPHCEQIATFQNLLSHTTAGNHEYT